MTDEELIAALGWEPCKDSLSLPHYCVTHGYDYPPHRAVCGTLSARLMDVRAGIELWERLETQRRAEYVAWQIS